MLIVGSGVAWCKMYQVRLAYGPVVGCLSWARGSASGLKRYLVYVERPVVDTLGAWAGHGRAPFNPSQFHVGVFWVA